MSRLRRLLCLVATAGTAAGLVIAPASGAVADTLAPQTITFDLPAAATVGGSYTPAIQGGASGQPVTLTTTTPDVCTVAAADLVQFDHVGTCTLDATEPGDDTYAPGFTEQSFGIGPSTQAITFTSTPTATTVGSTYVPAATGGGSPNPVTLTVEADPIGACTIDDTGPTVSFAHLGTCTIDADQAGSADYTPAPRVQQVVTIGAATQTIDVTSTPTSTTVGSTYAPAATGGPSGNPITFTVETDPADVCTLDAGGTITFAHVGTCTVDANQDASTDGDYSAAPQVQQVITIAPAGQTIVFTTTPASPAVGSTYAPHASGGASGNLITYTVDADPPGACTVADGTVTFAHLGTCTIDADQAGNDDYSAATQSQQVIAIGPAAQAIAFTSTPGSTDVGATYVPVVTGGGSGNAITLAVAAASGDACTIDNGTITFAHVGVCTVTADQAASSNGDYTAAAPAQQAITVGPATQTIAITSTPASTQVGATYSPLATGGASGRPVTLGVEPDPAGVCTISDGTITFAHIGACTVTADQAGTDDYRAAAQAQQVITVGPAAQTITFTSTPVSTSVGSTYTPAALGGPSGKLITYRVEADPADACTLTDGTITFAHHGTCTVDANQDAGGDYSAAPQLQQVINIVPAAQVLTFTGTPANQTVGSTYTPVVTGGASAKPVILKVVAHPDDACTISSGGTVALAHHGTCAINASQDASDDGDYAAASPAQQAFLIVPATQLIVFSSAPGNPTVGATYTPLVTGGASRQLVTLGVEATPDGACTLAAGTVAFVHHGTCTVDANQPASTDGDYAAAAQLQQLISIGKGVPAITLPAPIDGVVGQTVTAAPSSVSDGAYDYAVDATTAKSCSVTPAGVVTLLHVGSCTIGVAQDESNDYVEAPRVLWAIGVGKATTTMTVTVSPSSVVARLGVKAPASAIPAGTVQFYVDGAKFHPAVAVANGSATLKAAVPTGKTRHVTAIYTPTADFEASSVSTSRSDPSLTTTIVSPIGRTRYGWYRSPVLIRYRCVTHGAALAAGCPAPVALSASRAAQSVSRTILAVDGGAATATVRGINIDRAKPKVIVAGISSGNTYIGVAPKARCLTVDPLSGALSCVVHQAAHDGGLTTFTATGTDRAGNVTTVTGSYHVLQFYLREAMFDSSDGSYLVQTGQAYTLVALTSSRPRFYRPVVAGHRPTTPGAMLTRAGTQAGLARWTTALTFSRAYRTHTFWNIGVRSGATLHVLRLRIVG